MTTATEEVCDIFEQSGESGHSRALFKCCNFHSRTIQGVNLVCSDWIECNLRGIVFVECDLRGACFIDSDLKNARFERCLMYACELPNDVSIKCIDCFNTL